MREHVMAELKDEIAAYEGMQADLEARALGKWALVHDRALVGTFESFRANRARAVYVFEERLR